VALPALAIAAAVALFIRTRSPSASDLAIPMYSMTFEGADAPQRGPEGPTLPEQRRVVSKGARVHVVLRPADTAPAGIGARAFVVRGTTARLVPVEPDVAPTGAVAFEAGDEQLFGDEHGDLELVIFVGGADALPRNGDEALARSSDAATRIVRVPLRRP
jgi:hypothetical protein